MTKTHWLLIALAVSLGLNAGAVGTFAWHRYRRWREGRRFYRELSADKRTRMLSVLGVAECEMDSLRDEHFRARRSLALLGDEEQPDSAAVDSLLDHLAGLHREMNRLAFTTGREVFRIFPDRRRARARWERMHRHPRGRRHHRHRRGPHGPPRSRPGEWPDGEE